MPAEWAPHQATWVSWPHKRESWPGKLHLIPPVFARMVAALARSETVYVNVNHIAMEQEAREALDEVKARGDIRFVHLPTDDAWCRDYGAICVTRPPTADQPADIAATIWQFNAWGNKYLPYDHDKQIARQMAQLLGFPVFNGEMILEGGSIDVNGDGLLLTTEACLLNPNRNDGLSRLEIEQRLQEMLGIEKVLWLGDGIAGDDTDGHVDDLARFIAADTIVTVVEDDPTDANYQPLQENLKRLNAMRDLQGNPLRIITLPMPPPVFDLKDRLPASYANFYIANRVVLVPFFNHPNDQYVERVLQLQFPDREIVGIDCTDLILGLGAFHCLTQQIPALPQPIRSPRFRPWDVFKSSRRTRR
ncbi:MAG: agmatine deiminase family protein [Chloroflexaceae bacterium]|nr:agmatine deiminase family protein [Chloroflexaceae bacterium]